MCVIDAEPADFWSETWRRARKSHQCDACGGPIHPGVSYRVHFSVTDGHPWHEKMCALCEEVRRAFGEEHNSLCVPSDLQRTLRECISENDKPADKWRPMLAGILRRYHRSPHWLRRIYRRAAPRTGGRTDG